MNYKPLIHMLSANLKLTIVKCHPIEHRGGLLYWLKQDNYEMEYVRGNENSPADLLSRLPVDTAVKVEPTGIWYANVAYNKGIVTTGDFERSWAD